MKKTKRCEVEGCLNPAKYKLYKTFPSGAKKWLAVCSQHEGEIGNENLERVK